MDKNKARMKFLVAVVALVAVSGLLFASQVSSQQAWNGGRWDGYMVGVGPTAGTTSTPLFVLDQYGLGNILSVRDGGTPVFAVSNGGAVTGKVVSYDTAGSKLVCSSTTITDTATIATGLTTCVIPWASLAQPAGGDASASTAYCSSGDILVHIRNSALTPAPNATGAAVVWCAIGIP